MKACQLIIEGNWAHFKRPETNNNPLTHSFITKTALIGLIGAVIGKERDEMRELFPQLSNDFLYGVEVVNPVKKESWGFTMRKAVNVLDKAPKHLEFLKFPKFLVSIALLDKNSENIFNTFIQRVKREEACFTPVLGLHNCPANLNLISEGEFSELKSGEFRAKCFVSTKHTLNLDETKQFHIGLEKIPSYQNNNFWNLPEKYVDVVYPSEGKEITVIGEHYEYAHGEKWWLI